MTEDPRQTITTTIGVHRVTADSVDVFTDAGNTWIEVGNKVTLHLSSMFEDEETRLTELAALGRKLTELAEARLSFISDRVIEVA